MTNMGKEVERALNIIGDIELNCPIKERLKINKAFLFLEEAVSRIIKPLPVFIIKDKMDVAMCPVCRGQVKAYLWASSKPPFNLMVDPRPYCPECGQRLTGEGAKYEKGTEVK